MAANSPTSTAAVCANTWRAGTADEIAERSGKGTQTRWLFVVSGELDAVFIDFEESNIAYLAGDFPKFLSRRRAHLWQV
jgi:hypothetical protein